MAGIAGKQGGHVSRAQLLAIGLSRRAIDYRVKIGQLIPVYPGIYAVGHRPALPVDRAKGALLACGPGSALSHTSAATLWGFEKMWRFPLEVAVPEDRRRRGITTHRLRLDRNDLRIQLGVRVTSPARTILDIAPNTPTNRLTRIVNDARLKRQLTIDDLNDVLRRHPKHPGTRKLKPLAQDTGNPTRSQLEGDFKAFCKKYNLPTPLTNVIVAGYEVDALFPEQKLIVELDGYETHRDKKTFERDRLKDADTLRAGFNTVRLTRLRIKDTPQTEADRIHALLAKRAA